MEDGQAGVCREEARGMRDLAALQALDGRRKALQLAGV
jgi:hypothetical protein